MGRELIQFVSNIKVVTIIYVVGLEKDLQAPEQTGLMGVSLRL